MGKSTLEMSVEGKVCCGRKMLFGSDRIEMSSNYWTLLSFLVVLLMRLVR